MRIVNNLAAVVQRPVHIAEHAVRITVSIGVRSFADEQTRADSVLAEAGEAMCDAKARGGNGFAIYSPDLRVNPERRADIRRELQGALDTGVLETDFQPQVDAAGVVVAVEALLRWEHPRWGALPIDECVCVAEELGIIHALGLHVLEEACRHFQAWQMDARLRPVPKRLAVNVSAHQMRLTSFVDDVDEILLRTGMAPEALELELTERSVIPEDTASARAITALRARGVRVIIDDFGMQYSSLAYLKRLPVDGLKIDKMFVRDMAAEPRDSAIVESILSIARVAKLDVVAEGIEKVGDFEFLAARGCERYQGFLFARPMSGAAFLRYLQTRVAV
jgi:EAL domain-containing protein (putative c-di-GMP-specific phosphodiesterase class I)